MAGPTDNNSSDVANLILVLTIISLSYAIFNNFYQIKRAKSEETNVLKKLAEVEMNVKTVLGNKYQAIP